MVEHAAQDVLVVCQAELADFALRELRREAEHCDRGEGESSEKAVSKWLYSH